MALHVLVRLVHVAGMAVLLGGAVLAWAQLRTGTDDPLATAAAYEWLFWGVIGLVVLTGVGNLGAMAPAVPGPGTDWGLTFAIKLAAVVGLLAGSLARTLAVARRRALADSSNERPCVASLGRLPAVYAATVGYLLALVALAEVLARG
jgi:hypothetical protein